MNKDMALVLYYSRQNRYSFNALVAALETDEYFNDLDIIFIDKKEKLINKLGDVINRYESAVVGVSFSTTQLWEIYGLLRNLIVKYGNNALYLAGGPHPTGDPYGTLKMGFDFVVRGEGEETLIDLLKAYDCDEEFADIKGIGLINEVGEYQYTGRRPHIDLNKYPPFAVKHNKFGAMEITRGCPYVCHFCQTPYLFGTDVRHRSINEIIKYVEIMKDRDLRDIRFISPNAFSYGSPDGRTVNIDKIEEMLQSIRKIVKAKGRIFLGSFPSEVRPEHVNQETINVILKYADNNNLIIGGQSGSQKILDSCHRGHSVEDIYNAVGLTLRSGLIANVDFIFGLPGETEDDIIATIKIMRDLSKMGARIHAHTFIPLPQTPFAKAAAGRIGNRMQIYIDRLVSDGILYGDWLEQERIGKRIAKYLKDGIIEI